MADKRDLYSLRIHYGQSGQCSLFFDTHEKAMQSFDVFSKAEGKVSAVDDYGTFLNVHIENVMGILMTCIRRQSDAQIELKIAEVHMQKKLMQRVIAEGLDKWLAIPMSQPQILKPN